MNEDKPIHSKDLPKPQQDVDTKQAEEFIDKSSERKDEGSLPAGNAKRPNDNEPQPRNQ